MGKRVPDIVQVEWVDAAGVSGWHNGKDTTTEPTRIASVGYLHSENKKAITLLQSIDFDCDKIDHTIMVPKNRVTKITVIKKGRTL